MANERMRTIRAAHDAMKPKARGGNIIKCRREAKEQGLVAGTPEYLEFMEKCMAR